MDRKKVISFLSEHKELWSESRQEIVKVLKETHLISPHTRWQDVKTPRLIRETKLTLGLITPRREHPKHLHSCPECNKTHDCYTPDCPYPEITQCIECFHLEDEVVYSKAPHHTIRVVGYKHVKIPGAE